jgi:Integrase zinc binding domain
LSTSTLYTKIQREGIDIICRNGKIVLGPSLFTDILAWYHVNLNHLGQDRTYKTLHTMLYVPNMEAKVRQYVNQCQICKKSKIPNKKYGLLPETDIWCDPWEIIQI